MVSEPGEDGAHRQPPLRRPSRRWVAGALVVLAVVAMTASTIAIWTRQTISDTDRFMEVVEPALSDPSFYAGLSAIVTDASLDALDLEARVAELLDEVDAALAGAVVGAIDPDPQQLEQLRSVDRPTLGVLAPAISRPLEDRVAGVVDGFITSEVVEERLPELVRRTHAAGLALLTDDADALPNVYLEDDEVRVDLLPLVAEALRPIATELEPYLPDVTLPGMVADGTGQERAQLREELTAALGRQLPDDLGQLTLMRRSALEEAQLIARSLDRSVWAAVFLAVVLVASSIAISPDRRRTIQQLALGVVAGLATTMVIILQVEGAILARITDPDGTRAVGSLLGQLVSDLRTVTLLVAVAALVVGIAARRSWRPSRTVTPHA